MKCNFCEKEYVTHDEDAGTYKEFFCSKECETLLEELIYREPELEDSPLPTDI